MIEHRQLTKEELQRLIKEAELSETKFLRDLNMDIHEFFRLNSLIQDGLVINHRPIYIAALIKDLNNRINFWTVVNSNIDCVITLSKYVKRELKNWVEQFGTIFATMEKVNPKNMQWVVWLGFHEIFEDDNIVTYRIGE